MKIELTKKTPEVAAARVGRLAPLVRVWMEKNPNVKVSHLVTTGLKLALRPYAGKRHAHLLES